MIPLFRIHSLVENTEGHAGLAILKEGGFPIGVLLNRALDPFPYGSTGSCLLKDSQGKYLFSYVVPRENPQFDEENPEFLPFGPNHRVDQSFFTFVTKDIGTLSPGDKEILFAHFPPEGRNAINDRFPEEAKQVRLLIFRSDVPFFFYYSHPVIGWILSIRGEEESVYYNEKPALRRAKTSDLSAAHELPVTPFSLPYNTQDLENSLQILSGIRGKTVYEDGSLGTNVRSLIETAHGSSLMSRVRLARKDSGSSGLSIAERSPCQVDDIVLWKPKGEDARRDVLILRRVPTHKILAKKSSTGEETFRGVASRLSGKTYFTSLKDGSGEFEDRPVEAESPGLKTVLQEASLPPWMSHFDFIDTGVEIRLEDNRMERILLAHTGQRLYLRGRDEGTLARTILEMTIQGSIPVKKEGDRISGGSSRPDEVFFWGTLDELRESNIGNSNLTFRIRETVSSGEITYSATNTQVRVNKGLEYLGNIYRNYGIPGITYSNAEQRVEKILEHMNQVAMNDLEEYPDRLLNEVIHLLPGTTSNSVNQEEIRESFTKYCRKPLMLRENRRYDEDDSAFVSLRNSMSIGTLAERYYLSLIRKLRIDPESVGKILTWDLDRPSQQAHHELGIGLLGRSRSFGFVPKTTPMIYAPAGNYFEETQFILSQAVEPPKTFSLGDKQAYLLLDEGLTLAREPMTLEEIKSKYHG